ncbi:MAG: SpoIID/LytB domain-containing protein [Pyrinomonadaceae bacterium]|nr:SpoIID/LytB domain-containing protein [Pyrinomonadaceae bacterium]
MILSSRSLFAFLIPLLFLSTNISAVDTSLFYLENEPVVRIGLSTNSRSVTITTSDTSLVAFSPDEPQKLLDTTKVAVSARSYRPPEVEFFNLSITNIETSADASELAEEVRKATGEKVAFDIDTATNTWTIKIGEPRNSLEEADEFKAALAERGFENAEIVSTKVTQPSDEAVALTQQLAGNPKSNVRSILSERANPNKISPTSSSRPTTDYVNPNLREVIVNGAGENAKFSSLKAVSFGSLNERTVPVRYNGKEYRGRIEVFVNSGGSLTVVNVVPMEQYLLGVVPKELSLPQIEAQKAQAIAARTYAVANTNGFVSQGFDMYPTVRSQVYGGVSAESRMGSQAVRETRGLIATYKGEPITAYYTSTCGGRTEDSENIFDHAEPYLRGVNCSLEGKAHFAPFMVRSSRELADVRNEANYELARLAAQYSVNNFLFVTNKFTDEYFEEAPSETELRSWLNQIAAKNSKPFPLAVTKDTSKPLVLAKILADILYSDASQSDTLLSEADINYQLSFLDGGEVPPSMRATLAGLMRDGYFAIYPDLTIKPQKHFSRAKVLRLIENIYSKKNWSNSFESGEAKPTEDGKLIIRAGRGEKEIFINPNVYLFRKFGDSFFQVKEAALVGGERVTYKTNAAGEAIYLEIEPTTKTTVAERDSSFTNWNKSFSAGTVRANLSRYVRGLGTLIDLKIAKQGFSKRATDLEIITTTGTFHLKGGKIRSALRLNEQLFVINKKYDSAGRVSSYTFTGRGWGHGVGMCQYGAYGLAKMGVKAEAIIKHYYTGVDVTKAY